MAVSDSESWARLAELAAQFGPFFFAVIFIVFVPILGQQYFRTFLEQKTTAGEERDAAMKVYTFYWLSGIVTGLLLVAISVIWFFYVQMAYVLPGQQVTFEGRIRGVTEEDYLAHDILNPQYRVYISRISSESTALVAVVFKPKAVPPPAINLIYMRADDYRDAVQKARGIDKFAPLPLCLKHDDFVLIRDTPDKPPRFDKHC